MDQDGNVLYPVTIPGDNTALDVQLTHPGIAFIDFAGGGKEGMIISISVTYPVSLSASSGRAAT